MALLMAYIVQVDRKSDHMGGGTPSILVLHLLRMYDAPHPSKSRSAIFAKTLISEQGCEKESGSTCLSNHMGL